MRVIVGWQLSKLYLVNKLKKLVETEGRRFESAAVADEVMDLKLFQKKTRSNKLNGHWSDRLLWDMFPQLHATSRNTLSLTAHVVHTAVSNLLIFLYCRSYPSLDWHTSCAFAHLKLASRSSNKRRLHRRIGNPQKNVPLWHFSTNAICWDSFPFENTAVSQAVVRLLDTCPYRAQSVNHRARSSSGSPAARLCVNLDAI